MAATVNLSQLPAPAVVEVLDYEAILAAMLADLRARDPAYTAIVESDPAYKILEVAAYRETVLRQRVNDAAQAVMLAYALGTDLDQIGALFGVTRLEAETDSRLRARIQQGFAALGAAGPAAAYRAHAMAVSADIADVSVVSPAAGRVDVAVLAHMIVPAADADPQDAAIGARLFPAVVPATDEAVVVAPNDSPMLLAVIAALNAEDVRPLTDQVVVAAPVVLTTPIVARLSIYRGPDPSTVVAKAQAALAAHLAAIRLLGYDMNRAGIIAALAVPGVQNVLLDSPAADIVCAAGEIAVATSVSVSVVGVTE